MLRINRKPSVASVASAKLPSVYASRDYVEDGGRIAYGVSIPEKFGRSTSYVHKILNGARPADLPSPTASNISLIFSI
jgi:putative tryptophan/tyrosine transport system substrate-binding protein